MRTLSVLFPTYRVNVRGTFDPAEVSGVRRVETGDQAPGHARAARDAGPRERTGAGRAPGGRPPYGSPVRGQARGAGHPPRGRPRTVRRVPAAPGVQASAAHAHGRRGDGRGPGADR